MALLISFLLEPGTYKKFKRVSPFSKIISSSTKLVLVFISSCIGVSISNKFLLSITSSNPFSTKLCAYLEEVINVLNLFFIFVIKTASFPSMLTANAFILVSTKGKIR